MHGYNLLCERKVELGAACISRTPGVPPRDAAPAAAGLPPVEQHPSCLCRVALELRATCRTLLPHGTADSAWPHSRYVSLKQPQQAGWHLLCASNSDDAGVEGSVAAAPRSVLACARRGPAAMTAFIEHMVVGPVGYG